MNLTKTSIRTLGGTWIDLANPKLEDIVWEDIIQVIPNINRFGGHIRRQGKYNDLTYSVGQHSLLCAFYIDSYDRDLHLAALLHDAAEVYIGDVVRPMKAMFPQIKEKLEDPIARLIFEKAGLDPDLIHHPKIKEVDNRMLLTEISQLHPDGVWSMDHPLTPGEDLFDFELDVMAPQSVENLFRTKLDLYLHTVNEVV